MSYRSYVSDLLKTSEVRSLGNTFLYGSSYDLFNEYLSERSTAAIAVRRIGLGFEEQCEAEFYILLDFLTFVPFGGIGREHLRSKGVDVGEHAYAYALLLLDCAEITLSEAEKASLHRFFHSRSDLTLPADAVGIASAVRQLSDRLFNGIVLGTCAGSLGKAKALTLYLRQLAEATLASEGDVLDLSPVFSILPELTVLNQTQIEHLEAAFFSIQ